MDIVEAAQELAAVAANLNRQGQSLNQLKTSLEDLREPLVNQAGAVQEVINYIPEAIEADQAYGFGKSDALQAALDEAEEISGFLTAMLVSLNEADENLDGMRDSGRQGEDAIETALTALNSINSNS